MFDESQIADYAAIKAPEDLKSRIQKTAAKPRIDLRLITAIAACLVLVISVSVLSLKMLTPNKLALCYNGLEIGPYEVTVSGDTAMAVEFGMKSIVPTGIPLYVSADKDTKISVSGGSMQIFGKDLNDLLFVGTDFTLSQSADIRWDISGLESGIYTLTLDNTVYEVRIREKITIQKKEKNQ